MADRHARVETRAGFIGSIDGTHCDIQEPRKFPSTKWYSHKTNGPALTYQVILSLHESKILSVIGPFPAGESDLQVFRKPDGIVDHIPNGKRLIGDRGYYGEPDKIATPNEHDSLEVLKFKNRARSRHESLNARLKSFNALNTHFRHPKSDTEQDILDNHEIVFQAIYALVQYDLLYMPLIEL